MACKSPILLPLGHFRDGGPERNPPCQICDSTKHGSASARYCRHHIDACQVRAGRPLTSG